MKRKFSLLINIVVICLCVCAMAIGVYSATNASLKVSGQIGFTAHECELDVEITKQGYAHANDLTQYYNTPQSVDLSTNDNTTNAGVLGGKQATFNGNVDLGTMNFTDLADEDIPPIIVTIKVTNKSAFQVSGFVLVNDIINTSYTRVYSHNNKTGDHSNAIILEPSSAAEAAKTVTFTITLKVGNPDQNIDHSQALKIEAIFSKYNSADLENKYGATGFVDEEQGLTYKLYNNNTSWFVSAYTNQVTDIKIASEINNLPVTYIGDCIKYVNHCFKSTKLSKIEIPNSVEGLGDFSSCTNLTTFTMPNSVKRFGLFSGCSNLTTLNLSAGLQGRVGSSAFQNCSKLSVVNITSIEAWCNISFYNYLSNPLYYAQKLYINNELVESITIPKTISKIHYTAFRDATNLKSVTLPDTITEIDGDAFMGCTQLTKINIPNGVTSIGSSAFSGCTALKSIYLPDSCTTIGNTAMKSSNTFKGCTSLTDVRLPSNITWLGTSMFLGCTSLTNITIPATVTEIQPYLFQNCTSLRSITFLSSTPPSKSGTNSIFEGCNTSLITIYVPNDDAITAYQAVTDFANVNIEVSK